MKDRQQDIIRGEVSDSKPVRSRRSQQMVDRWADPVIRQSMIDAQRRHSVSQTTKDKIGEANRGHKHTDDFKKESSQKRGGVKIRGYALLLRGAVVGEIIGLTTLEKSQVVNLKSDLRRRGELPKPTKEEEARTKKKAHSKLEPSSESLVFAKNLLKSDLINTDLTFWNALLALYQRERKSLPENFSDQVRLEVFLRARNDKDLRLKYEALGREVSPDWFTSSLKEEEGFISANLANKAGYYEDEKGYFHLVNGKKFRPVGIVERDAVCYPPPRTISGYRRGSSK